MSNVVLDGMDSMCMHQWQKRTGVRNHLHNPRSSSLLNWCIDFAKNCDLYALTMTTQCALTAKCTAVHGGGAKQQRHNISSAADLRIVQFRYARTMTAHSPV